MKRLILSIVLVAALGPPVVAQSTTYVSPDVPTDPGIGIYVLPWEAVSHKAGVYGPPVPEFGIPGNPAIDALHKRDKPGQWLFSVEAPSDLGGTLSTPMEPRDVVLHDIGAGSTSLFFCGGGLPAPVPLASNVDAVFLVGGDQGDMVVSFDVPTTIAGTTYDPADLLRYTRFGPGCGNWSLVGLHFDASTAGIGVALSSNVIGADRAGGRTIMVFDIPTDLAPSAGPPTYIPGEIAGWDGATFTLFDVLGGWPLSSQVDALSCQANPGRVYDKTVYPFPLVMDKSTTTLGNVILDWSSSCASGAEDYGIYQGTIGTWNVHTRITCTDTSSDLKEEITPAAASSYYLVVPYNTKGEGSYGVDGPTLAERPVGTATCSPVQLLTSCP